MNERALVTGGRGFLGGWLVRHLEASGYEVLTVGRAASAAPGYLQTDLRDGVAAAALLKRVAPDRVFHLAGILGGPDVGWSELYEGNVLATLNLFTAIRSAGLEPWVLLMSSSAIYGAGTATAIAEDAAIRPVSLYGLTKAAQELIGVRDEAAFAGRVVRVRPFNVVGPGESPSLVISELARQVAAAEADPSLEVRVGNLEPRRDYTDVRDVVRVAALLAEADAPAGVYNICSGTSWSVQECLDALIGLACRPIAFRSVDSRKRVQDVPIQVGDSGRLRAIVDWTPRIPLSTSLKDVLDEWRARVAPDAQR